ncbi:hypothetical protein C4J81_09105 [Deltaproteobacteria bacterium Smac51]|nr:hypothetical protein C4J81_09105 [Deltaproteobacteria bacterium Smac51]
MNNEMKLLLWNLAGPYDASGGETWEQRLPTIGSVLKSDAYDFVVMQGVSAPEHSGQGYSMLIDILNLMPDYSFCYTRHLPNIQTSEGIVMCYRHSRWEAEINGGFRLWPPNTDRVLFCVLFHELDQDKKRTGRKIYVASSQSRDDEDLDIMREAIAMQMGHYLSKRPLPEVPVIWAGDVGMGEPSRLYDYVTGHTTAIADQESATPQMAFQDSLAILHPGSHKAASVNNWRDYQPDGGVRRDFVFLSEGLAPVSLDFNYIRTPGGQFPSNHFPQRAVISFDEKPKGSFH